MYRRSFPSGGRVGASSSADGLAAFLGVGTAPGPEHPTRRNPIQAARSLAPRPFTAARGRERCPFGPLETRFTRTTDPGRRSVVPRRCRRALSVTGAWSSLIREWSEQWPPRGGNRPAAEAASCRHLAALLQPPELAVGRDQLLEERVVLGMRRREMMRSDRDAGRRHRDTCRAWRTTTSPSPP